MRYINERFTYLLNGLICSAVMVVHVTLQYDTLSGLVLPSKRAFDNMNKEFLEKRKIGLNTYLQVQHQKSCCLGNTCNTFIEFLNKRKFAAAP